MKGKATFTLTNARTGRIDRKFTEENLVTDAMDNLLNPPLCLMMHELSWSRYIQTIVPFYKNMMSGIMLLGNTLEERKDNILLPPDFIPVATAGAAYSGAQTTRGSLNLNESYELENGYHFTWDFGTDKANGTIKSCALTSRLFGNSGFEAGSDCPPCYINPDGMRTDTMNCLAANAKGKYICSPKINEHLYYTATDSNHISIKTICTPDPNAIKIKDIASSSAERTPSKIINIELPITIAPGLHPFYNGALNRLYFFEMKTLYNENLIKLVCCYVDLKTFTAAGRREWTINRDYREAKAVAYYKGDLYYLSYSGLRVFDSQGVCTTLSSSTYNDGGYSFSLFNETLYIIGTASHRSMIRDGELLPCKIYGRYAGITSPALKLPFTMVASSSTPMSADTNNPYVGVISNYLATINNLSEPLVKTNEHTLKITYDIVN